MKMISISGVFDHPWRNDFSSVTYEIILISNSKQIETAYNKLFYSN
jgi:hypothetical protein